MPNLCQYDKIEREKAMQYASEQLGLIFVRSYSFENPDMQQFKAKDQQGNVYIMGLFDSKEGFKVRVLNIGE